MVLTNAERQRRYQLKKKEENKEEYLLKKREEAKTYYYKKIKDQEIPIKEEIIKEELPKLEALKKRINPIKKTKLTPETIKQYINVIKNLKLKYDKSSLNEEIIKELILLLNNEKYNITKLNKELLFIKKNLDDIIKNDNTYINKLYGVALRLKYNTVIVKKLYPYVQYKNNKYDIERNQVKANEEKIKILSFKKEDVLEEIKNSSLNPDEILIYGLLMLFPTRRIVDYRRMVILKEPPKDKNNNYYYNKKFYFYITKNKKEQIYDVPEELDNLINKQNNYLLGKNYNQSSLSKKINVIFNKIYGKSISAREVRHYYATYMDDKYKDFNERLENSDKMNHSVIQNNKYVLKK